MNFSNLLGKTIVNVFGMEVGSDEIILTLNDGSKVRMWHCQDCCESVSVEDVIGDPSDLLNYPLLVAEEAKSNSNPEGVHKDYQDDSFTWTFYKLATIKGYVDIRWYGESNGYYSEEVSVETI